MAAEPAPCDTFIDSTGAAGNIICLTANDVDDNGNLKNFPNNNGVIFFYADWCGHCKVAKPEFAAFSNKIKGTNTRAFAVNADKNRDLLNKIKPAAWGYEVRGFPTIVGYANGKFFSEYGFDPAPQATFRKADDFVQYSNGLGTATVEWQ